MKKHGDKLKNETSQARAMRAKFRTGRADTSITKAEKVKTEKLHKQGRKAAYRGAALSGEVRRRLNESNEDGNTGADAINAGIIAVENGYYSIKAKAGKNSNKTGYSSKLHKVSHTGTVSKTENVSAHEAQKSLMKKEIQRAAIKERARESANSAGNISKKFVDKAEDMAGKLAEALREFVEEHPLGIILAGVLLLIILLVCGSLSSCSILAGGGDNMVVGTSYTSEDADIVAVEGDYKGLEAALQTKINNVPADHPGFNEYNYSLATIEHDPFELAALLTVLYEDYTESEALGMLQTIFDCEYTLSFQEVTEIRTRTETRWHYVTYYRSEPRTGTMVVDGKTVTYTYYVSVPYEVYESYEAEVEYEYYILNTTLTNSGISAAVSSVGLTDDQMERYDVLVSLKGNKPDIFD